MSIYVDFDTKLCMQLQEGNEEAFAQAFTQYNRLLYAIAYRYLKSGEEAEDAVQHTFMKLWEERKRLDFRNGVRSLLYTILRHYVLNELRHRTVVYEKNYELAQETEETEFPERLPRTGYQRIDHRGAKQEDQHAGPVQQTFEYFVFHDFFL